MTGQMEIDDIDTDTSGDTGSDADDTGSDADDTGSDVDDTGGEADDTGSNAEDTGSNADDTGSDAEDTGSDAEDTDSDNNGKTDSHLPDPLMPNVPEVKRMKDIVASTVPSAIEETLCNLGLGLSNTPSSSKDPSLCILLHLSGHPWLDLNPQREEYFNYQIEWDYVTQKLPTTPKAQFLQALWASSSQLQTIYDHFQVPFRYFVVKYDGRALMVAAKGPYFGRKSDTEFASSPFSEFYTKNNEEGIFLLKLGHHFRLISSLDALYPNKLTYAEKLLDFMNQFQMLSKEVEARAMIESVDSILSSTETVDRINGLVKEVSSGLTLEIIWSRIFSKMKALNQHFIIQKLMVLERSHDLTSDELMRLRISLIHSFTIELFRPLRKIVLEEKERQEVIAEDMADRLNFLKQAGELLNKQISSTEKEITNLVEKLKLAKDELNKSESSLKKSSKEDEERLKKLQKQFQDFKGQVAVNDLIQKLSSPPLESFRKISEGLKEMTPFSNLQPRVLVEKICQLFEVEFTPELQHGSSSFDPTLLDQILDTFQSIPVVEIDEEGDICVSGRNVMLSSIKDELIRIVKTERHSQIKIQCQEVLTLDTNLEKEDFHGINVVMVASKILVAEHEVIIDVSGLDGEPHRWICADDGANEGDSGQNGLDGNPGESGGSVHIEATSAILNHENLRAQCGGGKGAEGQNGGDGHKGRDGDNGTNAWTTAPDWTVFGNEFYTIKRGFDGKRGQPGGAGGHAGLKGQGGLGGKFRIVENGKDKLIQDFLKGDDADCDAYHGNPGENGYDGIKGKDHGFACESRIYSWKEKMGYNLRTVNTTNYFGSHIGYILEEGETPSYTQQAINQTKVNTRKQNAKAALKANVISTQTIQAMKNSILASSTLDEVDKGAELQEKIDGVSGQIRSIKSSNQAKEESLAKQHRAIENLQQRHVLLEKNLSSSRSKTLDIENSIIQSRKQQEEAALRAKEVEQAAINLKEAQEGALQMSSLLQMQAVAETQVQSQAMQLTEISVQNQELSSTALRNVSKQAAESASNLKSHFDPNYAAFLKLVQQVTDFEVQSAIETAFQKLVDKDLVLSDKELVALLEFIKASSKNKMENLSMLNYFNNFFLKDLEVSREFHDPKRNWFKIFIDLRSGFLEFHNISSIPKKKELKIHLDLIQVELVYSQLLQNWLTMEISEGTILFSIPVEQRPHAQNRLMNEGVQLFEVLKSNSGLKAKAAGLFWKLKEKTGGALQITNSVDIMEDPQVFLKKMIEVMSQSKGPLEEPPLRPFAKTLEAFNYEHIKNLLKLLKDEKDPENCASNFKYLQFLLQYASLDALHLGKVWKYVQELAETCKGKEAEIAELENFVQKTYESLRGKLLMQIKAFESNPHLLRTAIKVIDSKNTPDSEKVDTIFQARLEFYEKLQKSSNPSEQLFEIYNRGKSGYIHESTKTLNFNSFLKFILNEFQNPKDQNLKQILYHLEVGKFSNGELQDFSLEELVAIENLLWNQLTDTNSKNVNEVARLITKSSALSKIEAAKLKAKCDTAALAEECDKILGELLQYVPVSNTESGITQERRLRRYLRFIILEIQLALIFGMQCEKIAELKDALSKVDTADVDKIVKQLEEFLQLVGFKKVPLELTDLQICSQENPWLSFRQALHFIKWNMSMPDDANKTVLINLKMKLDDLEIDEDNEEQSTWETGRTAALEVVNFLRNPTTASYPSQALLKVLSVKEKELEARHRQLRNFEGSLNRRLLKIKAYTENLFITAGFFHKTSAQLQQEVLDEDLEMAVLAELSASRKPEKNATKLAVKIELLKMIMEAYPFMNEFDILSGVAFAGQTNTEARLSGFQILQAQLKEVGKSDEDQWSSLVSRFQEAMNKSTSKMLRHQLGKIIVSLKFGDPLIPFLLRVVQNLGDSFGKKQARIPELDSAKTTEAMYKLLIQKDDPDLICNYFLQGEEVEIFKEILNLVKQDHEDDFRFKLRTSICTLNPLGWRGWLEQTYFNKVYKLLTSQCSSSLRGMKYFADQAKITSIREEKHATSAEDDEKKLRKENLLRVLINAQFYPYFKVTYALQEPETRLKWLTLIRRLTEKVGKSKFGLFRKPSCVKIFLILLRDVNLQDLEVITSKRFPQNWIKEVLISGIKKDFEGQEGLVEVERHLRTLLCTVTHPILQFLILFHNVLRMELSLLSAKENKPCKLGQKILESLANGNFTPLQIHGISTEIQQPHLKPFAHWPRILRILKLGFSFPTFDESLVESLLSMDENYNEETVNSLAEKLSKLNPEKVKLAEIIEKFSSLEWILDEDSIKMITPEISQTHISQAIVKYSEKKRENELSLDELLINATPLHLNQGIKGDLEKAKMLVMSMYEALKSHYDMSSGIHVNDLKIKVLEWVGKWKETFKPSWSPNRGMSDNHISQTVALIYRAMEWHFAKVDKSSVLTRKPRNSQLLSIMMLILGLRSGNGRLGQIQTGEGKSCIVAMFAAFCSLLKAHVHIITSNIVLAKADAEEFHDFFEAVLGLKVHNNCDKDAAGDEERGKRYNNNVVYGELTYFQGDFLNTFFHGKQIFKTPDVIIVDEVDSLVLDKGSNMLYLSHSIPELKHLRFVFLLIWDAVNARAIPKERKVLPKPYTESDVHIVRKTVEKKLEASDGNVEVQVPKCLEEFVRRRVGIWVKQAFMARFMEANDQFKVDEGKQSIVNMDNDTGVEQANMHLSLGLHQFLQLKYKAKLTPESLKCVFISNLDYFSKFKDGQLFGITGTIGGPDETQLLSEQYGVTFFEMPRYQLSKRVQQPSVIVQNETAWQAEIVACVESRCSQQPILIITENLAALEKVSSALKSARKPSLNYEVLEYKSSERDAAFTEEVKNKYGGLNKLHVVISTNLGGRGTDFAIHEDAKKSGLHVILTFLPPNLRVEKQAFGRTARAGKNGTTGFIIQVDPSKVSSMSLYHLKEMRREAEAKRIQIMREKDIPRIKMEDELFKLYTNFYKREIQTCSAFRLHQRRIRKLQLEFLNNRWAMWLDSIKFRIEALPHQGVVGEKAILKKFEKFKATQYSKLTSKRKPQGFAELTSELTKLAIQYEKLGTKSLLGSVMDADYEETGEIIEDTLDTVKEVFNDGMEFATAVIGNVRDTFHTAAKVLGNKEAITEFLRDKVELLKGLPDNAGDGLTELLNDPMNSVISSLPVESIEKIFESLENTHSKKSDLEIGLEILELAQKLEHGSFTEPPTAYSSAFVLQTNPGKRREAKKLLKAAVGQINSKVELNHSAIHWLQTTSQQIEKNEEAVRGLVKRNRFQEQMMSETNLLNIHLNSIHSILVSPVTPKVLQSQILQVDTEVEAVELLEHLLNPDWKLLKGYRFSRRAAEMNLKDQLKACPIFCSFKNLKSIIQDKKRSTLQPEDFEELVITKRSFLEELKAKELLEDVEVDLVVLNENIFKETQNQAKTTLKQAMEAIAGKLSGIKDHVLPEELKIFSKELLKIRWIRTEKLPLKVTQSFRNTMECMGSNNSCNCTSGFHNSELYGMYSNLVETLATMNIFKNNLIEAGKVTLIDYDSLPFPETKEEAALELFKNLVSRGVIKEPRVKFPALEGSGRQKRIETIENTLNSEEFRECLAKWAKANEATAREQEIKNFVASLKEILLGSIGTLKRFDELRVHYESISSMVPLDLGKECSDELNEMLSEGVFDRVMIFDEYVCWYKNKACFVALLGVAEIALGVAVEYWSGGLLSPLASFLISEGSSDFTYAMRHLIKGNQVTWEAYKEDKIDSMIWSGGQALTLGFIPGAGIAMDLLGTFAKTVFKEVLKGSAKALLFNFIESNVKQGLKTNILGINLILDHVVGTQEIMDELQNFQVLSAELWAAAWEKDLAVETIEKLVELSISAQGKNSIFNQELEAMHLKIKWTMRMGMIVGLAKSVLPIGNKSLEGSFGSSESKFGRLLDPTQKLILLTLQGLNLRLKEKTDKFKSQRKEMDSLLQVGNPATTNKEKMAFQNGEFLKKQTTIIQKSVRERILKQFIKEITGQTVRAELHESIRKGYARTLVTYNLRNVREYIEEEGRNAYNEEAEDEEKVATKSDDWEHSTTVSNAWGRTVLEVRDEWKETLGRIASEDLEFLTDNRGNCFVCPIFQESLMHKFVLDLQPQAFDELLQWALGMKTKGMLKVAYTTAKQEKDNAGVQNLLSA